MPYPFIDTDVILRLLLGDDPEKQERSARLFQQVEDGELTIAVPVSVIADAVYVLSSPVTCRRSRQEIAAMLLRLVRMPHFRVESRSVVIDALTLYGYNPFKIDFSDALLLASMWNAGSSTLYSYDQDLGRVQGVTRREP